MKSRFLAMLLLFAAAGCDMEFYAPGYEVQPDIAPVKLRPPRYEGHEIDYLGYYLPGLVPGYVIEEAGGVEAPDGSIRVARILLKKQLSTRRVELAIFDSRDDLNYVRKLAHGNIDTMYEDVVTNVASNPSIESTQVLKPEDTKHDIGIGEINTISVKVNERIYLFARGDDTPFGELYELLRLIDEEFYSSELMRLRVDCRKEGIRDEEMAPGRYRIEVARTCVPGDHVDEMKQAFERRAALRCPNGYRGGLELTTPLYATFKEFVCESSACQAYPLVTGVIRCR